MTFLSGYGKRKKIEYGTVFPGSNLAHFPKRIHITADADIAAELSSANGIAITEADGTTTIPFGLYPTSDPANGTIELRANFLSLLTAATTGDTLGYLYYDHTQTTTEDKDGVMDGNYTLFMPLDEDPSGSAPQMFDWVTESNLGTSAGSMTSGDLIAGKVGNSLDFDGSDDSITLAAGVGQPTGGPGAEATWEFITKYSSGSQNGVLLEYSPVNSALLIFLESGALKVRGNGSGGRGHDLRWQALLGGHGQRDRHGGRHLRDPFVPGGSTYLGRGVDFSAYAYTGQIDEVRVSQGRRSADWLAYSYQDEFNNSDTFTLGAEESAGGGFTFKPWILEDIAA